MSIASRPRPKFVIPLAIGKFEASLIYETCAVNAFFVKRTEKVFVDYSSVLFLEGKILSRPSPMPTNTLLISATSKYPPNGLLYMPYSSVRTCSLINAAVSTKSSIYIAGSSRTIINTTCILSIPLFLNYIFISVFSTCSSNTSTDVLLEAGIPRFCYHYLFHCLPTSSIIALQLLLYRGTAAAG